MISLSEVSIFTRRQRRVNQWAFELPWFALIGHSLIQCG
jgi:hypothetical protein